MLKDKFECYIFENLSKQIENLSKLKFIWNFSFQLLIFVFIHQNQALIDFFVLSFSIFYLQVFMFMFMFIFVNFSLIFTLTIHLIWFVWVIFFTFSFFDLFVRATFESFSQLCNSLWRFERILYLLTTYEANTSCCKYLVQQNGQCTCSLLFWTIIIVEDNHIELQ